ncbi:hypothetical protein CEP53_004341 [Fusarium sp. AF-6]|nr:hypothetical protein CEP53_004341 [Fusarium sp. AF-6]
MSGTSVPALYLELPRLRLGFFNVMANLELRVKRRSQRRANISKALHKTLFANLMIRVASVNYPRLSPMGPNYSRCPPTPNVEPCISRPTPQDRNRH